MSTEGRAKVMFGPFEVTSQVFLTTPHSFALVNLKPLAPGHVLVCPAAPHARLTDLTPQEISDLFTTVQRVQHMLARRYFRPASTPHPHPSSPPPNESPAAPQPRHGSFNVAVQDGPGAGQTVPHVHVHIIPRPGGGASEGGDGDELYERMAGEEGNVGGALWDREVLRERGDRPVPGGAFARIEDANRKARSMEDMEAEAETYRGLLREMDEQDGA